MKTRFIFLALCVLFTLGVCHEDAEFPEKNYLSVPIHCED